MGGRFWFHLRNTLFSVVQPKTTPAEEAFLSLLPQKLARV
jgi:hypothetical protein